MDEFYTINQVAIILKVHPLTVRRYIRESKLKAVRAGGNVRVALNDLREFMQSFIPHTKSSKSSPALHHNRSFSLNDSMFRLKARGLSTSGPNQR